MQGLPLLFPALFQMVTPPPSTQSTLMGQRVHLDIMQRCRDYDRQSVGEERERSRRDISHDLKYGLLPWMTNVSPQKTFQAI